MKNKNIQKKAREIFCRVFLVSVILPSSVLASDVGRRFPSEMRKIVDAKTGVTITALTTSPASDDKIYQTHPQWTADGKYIIFRSNRAAEGRTQAFAVNETTGEIIQLTDGPGIGTGSLNVARKSNKLYFFRGGRGEPATLIELNLDALFADSLAGKTKDPAGYERKIMTMPAGLRESGGFSLDADEKVAYVGVRLPSPGDTQVGPQTASGNQTGQQAQRQGAAPQPVQGRAPGEPIPQVPSGIRSIDLRTGEVKTVIDTPFTMGHVQANPWVSGEILYCQETGGDAPQRMWFVRADGTGNQKLYQETPDEWVTHEIWLDKDFVLFNVLGHQPKLRTKPQGILSISVRNQEVRLHGQVDGRGYWHCAGTADRKWAVGDTFTGELYVLNLLTGESKLLSTGHRPPGDQTHSHHTMSPDGRRVLFNSGMLGNRDVMIITLPVQ
jgi:oligogalacturonide lyase